MNASERSSGVGGLARRVARATIGPLYRPVRRLGGFLAWSFPVARRLVARERNIPRRLLVIYDTSSQPFSVGDVLLVQEASLVIREQERLHDIDFAVVHNPEKPASSDPAFAAIKEENAFYHLAAIIPIAQVNQHLGSVFVFNSHAQLQRFIADNGDLYHVWPSAWKYAKREYLYYGIFEDVLYRHYMEYGSVPHLSCRPFLAKWAQEFYRENVFPNIPITVNLRNNTFHTHRNLRIESWVDFFRQCEDRYPATFTVICARSEIDERLRECRNVIVAKDHGTTLEQDLALIHGSAIHMGADSGPVVMALFSDKPYLVVNTVVGPHYFSRSDLVQVDGDFLRFIFAGPLQRYASGVETAALLSAEFERMWRSLDVPGWWRGRPVWSEDGADSHTWLR